MADADVPHAGPFGTSEEASGRPSEETSGRPSEEASGRPPGEALVLAAHGSHADARSSRPVLDHADRLRDAGPFDEVRTAFWKGEPSLRSVLAAVERDAATVVPVMTSEGYFVEEVFPRELRVDDPPPAAPATVRYADPVGTHPAVTDVVERRAAAAAADPAAAAVAVVGHGTDRHATSGASARFHVRRLRRRDRFAEVGALYLDETPRVDRLTERFDAAECVVVPLFVADAGHVVEDVPAAVADGAAGGGGAGRQVRYAGAVGTDPGMATLAVARAVEAGAELRGDGTDVRGHAGAERRGSDDPAPAGDHEPPAVGALRGWVERADTLPARARRAALADGLSRTWGELLVTVTATPAGGRRYEVRHVADAGADRSALSRLPGPRALRDRARFDAGGRFRPLRSARSFPDGWVLADLDGRELAAALDHAYPASVARWAAGRAGRLDVTHFRETAERQTGRYQLLADVPSAVVESTAAACCSDCVRQRRWGVDAGESATPAASGHEPDAGSSGADGPDGAAIPCPEPCPVVLAAAREFALLERGRDPDGELGRAGERYRARYRRAKRSDRQTTTRSPGEGEA